MNISFNFKNIDSTEGVKEYARKRFDKLDRLVDMKQDNSELIVNLSVEKLRQVAEVVLVADNMHLSAYQESEDMYSSIDLVLDKLEVQVKKMRERMKAVRREAQKESVRMDIISLAGEGDDQAEPTIVETDHYEPKPMYVDEAAMQLDALEFEFLVFRNAKTQRINVIYHRKNGDYGLIDPGQ